MNYLSLSNTTNLGTPNYGVPYFEPDSEPSEASFGPAGWEEALSRTRGLTANTGEEEVDPDRPDPLEVLEA